MEQCFEVLDEYVRLADWRRPDGWCVDIAFVRTVASVSIDTCHKYLKENDCDILASFSETYDYQIVIQNIAALPFRESWFVVSQGDTARTCKGLSSRPTKELPKGMFLLCTRSWEVGNNPLATGPFRGKCKEL